MNSVRKYLAEIGRRGGRKSRRALDRTTARDMVRVREARRAFRRFRTTCFWSYRPDLHIGLADVAWVAEQLMRHGNREAWRVGARLCRSDDLDFFHDAEARVASAFATDRERLLQAGYRADVEVSLPGFVRAVVGKGTDATRVDWAHDSAWRFLPLVRDPLGGLLLHPVDLAVNKALALAGRDEPRDFVDILFAHRTILPLAALCWAAAGKDPGFTPLSLLELLKRRGRYHPEDFARLHLAEPFDLVAAKQLWLKALEDAEVFARARPPDEAGCLYYHQRERRFVTPAAGQSLDAQGIVPHFGAPGGVVPRVADQRLERPGPA